MLFNVGFFFMDKDMGCFIGYMGCCYGYSYFGCVLYDGDF